MPASAIGVASLVASLVSTAVASYSAYASAENQKETADYNKKIGEMKAQDSLQRGVIEAAARRDKARRVASTQAEGISMSGMAIDTGTPLALLTETAGLGELDALRTINNAQREGWGYKAQANLDEFQGNAAMTAGRFNAAGTFLNGAAGAAKSFYGYKKDGTF